MSSQFVVTTGGLVVIRDGGERLPIHNVPNGLEAEFNAVTETKSTAVRALLIVFAAHNVECDPRNRATVIQNLRDMRIVGQSIAVALENICHGDAALFAEQIFARSPQLAEAVHRETGATTFANDRAFHLPLGLAAPPGNWR